MKLDIVKEEVANIRQWQNICCVAFMGVFAYFFTEVEPDPIIRTVSACMTSMGLGVWFFILQDKMNKKLKELEQTKKDD